MRKNEHISYLNNEYPSVRIMNVCGKIFVYVIRNGKCHSCWAIHFCGICPAALLNDGKFHLPNDEECEIVKKNICLQLKKYIMLLNRDELYEKLETAILNLPKRTFLNYREPLNIRLYEKD